MATFASKLTFIQLSFSLWLLFDFVHAQAGFQPASTVPVPPLQWIQIKPNGTAGPALAYSAAGFDYINDQLVIFGGETPGGLLDGNTHIFDMATLSWTTPSPSTNQNVKPPARSRALVGHDIIASYRNGLLVYGGKGDQGALSDVWEYAFSGQFWHNVTVEGDVPSARYDAVGGGDPPSISNANTNLITTFWLTGGVSTQASTSSSGRPTPGLEPFDDLYRLQMTGTIAPNVQNAVARWEKVASPSAGELTPRHSLAGLMRRMNEGQAKLGLYGGCTSASENGVSCAEQDAYVISTTSPTWNSIPKCPSARIGGSLVPTYNSLFDDMAFLVLGLAPAGNTTDDYALNQRGEIDVLNLSSGTWSRVLPSCDPSSNPPCPIPREGAAVVSSANSMAASAGGALSASSDILIFGGKDAQGNVLNDLWILRATTALITHTNQTDWGPQATEALGSGVNTNGQGVTVEFLTQCAQAANNSPPGSNPPSSGNNNNQNSSSQVYNVGAVHKALAPVSIVVILVSILLLRSQFGSASSDDGPTSGQKIAFATMFLGWALGTAGFATSFTTAKKNTLTTSLVLSKRASSTGAGFISSAHAIVGIILFVLAYIAAPIFIFTWRRAGITKEKGGSHQPELSILPPRQEDTSPNTATEKSPVQPQPSSFPVTPDGTVILGDDDDGEPLGAGEKVRLSNRRSSAPSAFFKEQLWSSAWSKHPRRRNVLSQPPPPPASLTEPSTPPTETGFVVLNRGRNALNRNSSDKTNPTLAEVGAQLPLSLGDVSWLERRRHLGLVGDLDYAMSQHAQRSAHSRSPSAVPLAPRPEQDVPQVRRTSSARFPPKDSIVLRIALHLLLFALCIFTAEALFSRSGNNLGIPLGSVFVVLVAIFYLALILLASRGKPHNSSLAVIIDRLRGTSATTTSGPQSTDDLDLGTFRMGNISHETRMAIDRSSHIDNATLQSSRASRPLMSSHRYSGEEYEGQNLRHDDEDDDAERIEREMERREISIVTVPKRRLFIANSDAQ
ncbi:hypothetical protein CPB86DRAFT_804086 [Serendipita vermifera]|nr:hypothetical protein CPB86DRAFT_804086 [Serendipita vermifera]